MVLITEQELETYIKAVKEQEEVEANLEKGFSIAFPDSYPPIINNPIMTTFCQLVDKLLGIEDSDFFSWWVYETDMGKREDFCVYTEDGGVWEFQTAKDIIEYAKYNEQLTKQKLL